MLEGKDRSEWARDLVRDSARGTDGDPLSQLNPLDIKFFRNGRVNVQIPIADPINTRRCILFLMDELPGLLAEMDRLKDRRSKSLLAMTKLRVWSQAFSRGLKGYGKV